MLKSNKKLTLHNVVVSKYNIKVYEIENNTWICGNIKFISIVNQDISRVSKANE